MTDTRTGAAFQDSRRTEVQASRGSAPGRLRDWLRTDAAARWILLAILVAGAFLRLTNLRWDDGTHIHPDERFLTFVTSALELPENLGQFFDSPASPMNPYNRGFGFFVYGTLPLFIVRVLAGWAQGLNEVAQLWTAAPGIPLALTGYDGVYLVGRALSGLFDLGCVWLLYLIGRRLYSVRAGLLAAALYAFAVLPLQQSHFYTVDTFASFFAVLTLYLAVRVAQGGGPEGRRGGGWWEYLLLGASLGAGLACRINLAPLAGIALLAAGMRAWEDWRRAASEQSPGQPGTRGERAWLGTLTQATLFRVFLIAAAAVVAFRVGQPYAFGGTSFLDFSFATAWRDNMKSISEAAAGNADSPPIHQWANRQQFVFPWINMVVWGMGLPLGLAAWAGWLTAAWQTLRGLTGRRDAEVVRAHLLPVAWIGVMFVYHSIQFAYSMRYYLPIYAPLALMAAWLLWRLVDAARERAARSSAGRTRAEAASVAQPHLRSAGPARGRLARMLPPLAYALLAAVTIGTLLWGWGFLAVYRRPLTRITASEWMYQNIPEGSVVANEEWDDGLPFNLEGRLASKPAGYYYGLSQFDRPILDAATQQPVPDPETGRPQYNREGSMQNYGEDTPDKRERLYQWLNEADVIVLSSNRLWGSIPRLPMRYPMTSLYYELLMDGRLGFELAARFTSFPTIFGIQFDDTWAEEAFSVYDHPEVRIYRRTAAYSEELARSYFDPLDLENTIMMWPKQVTQAPTALMMTADEAELQRAGGTWSEMFDEDSPANRSQVVAVLWWLLIVELVGLAAFPIAFVALRRLGDRGYGVTKILGLLLLAWLSWIGPGLKVAPYQRWTIVVALGLMLGVSALLAWPRRRELARFVRERSAVLLTEEGVFLALFLLFLLVRAGNPDLWHPARGGEKPMDLAYLNAVIRSTIFPPYDPWHAGGYLNYYYFGFVIVATVIKLTGIVPWVAYNLAVPTLFALLGVGAFSTAFNLADGDPATGYPDEAPPYRGLRIGSLLAGLAAVFTVAVIGNLGNVKLIFDQLVARSTAAVAGDGIAAGLVNAASGLVAVLSGKTSFVLANDWWFWNASRVVQDTINEFPFFTFTYADLHAHMIALPLTVLALAAAVALVRSRDGARDPVQQPAAQALAAAPREPSPWRIRLGEVLPLLVIGLALGALRATNTWDFPTYVLVALAALGVSEAVQRGRLGWPEASAGSELQGRVAYVFRGLVSVLWRTVVVLLVGMLAFYPYSRDYATAYGGLQLWEESRTDITSYVVVHGFFLAMGLIFLVSELVTQVRQRSVPGWLVSALPWLAAAGLVLIGAGWLLKIRIWLIALPMALAAVALAFGRDVPPVRRFGLLLLGLALAITMGVEIVRLKDDIGRMNTVFKFYLQAWVMFGITAAYGLAVWAPRSLRWPAGWRRLALGAALVLFLGVMLYPPLAARAKMRDRFSETAAPHGLDGMAYMDQAQYYDNNRELRLADDKAAMLWLMRSVAGSPVILEAQTPEYRWGSRFSIYTGLPAVQGWNWHQRQQRSVVPGAVVERRVNHVQEIYNTTDLVRAQHLLDLYQVSYVIVGELERAYYAGEGLAKFDALVRADAVGADTAGADRVGADRIGQAYLRVAYQEGSVTIYEVVGRGRPVQAAAPSGIGPRPVPTPTAPVPTAPPPATVGANDHSPLRPPAPEVFESPLPGADPFASPRQ